MTKRKADIADPRIISTPQAQSMVAHLLRRAVQIFIAVFFEHMEVYDVTPAQYAALVTVNDHPGLDQRTLGSIASIDRSTIGGAVRLLEAKGLVRRVTPPENQRIKQLFITATGRKLLVDSRDELEHIQADVLAPLRPAERTVLIELLSKVVQGSHATSRPSLKRPGERAIQ